MRTARSTSRTGSTRCSGALVGRSGSESRTAGADRSRTTTARRSRTFAPAASISRRSPLAPGTRSAYESFRALVAPMLIDSYTLEQRVLTSTLPAEMLQGVRQAGSRRARGATRPAAQGLWASPPARSATPESSPARGSASAPAASPAGRSRRSAAMRSSTPPATQPRWRGLTEPSSIPT